MTTTETIRSWLSSYPERLVCCGSGLAAGTELQMTEISEVLRTAWMEDENQKMSQWYTVPTNDHSPQQKKALTDIVSKLVTSAASTSTKQRATTLCLQTEMCIAPESKQTWQTFVREPRHAPVTRPQLNARLNEHYTTRHTLLGRGSLWEHHVIQVHVVKFPFTALNPTGHYSFPITKCMQL